MGNLFSKLAVPAVLALGGSIGDVVLFMNVWIDGKTVYDYHFVILGCGLLMFVIGGVWMFVVSVMHKSEN